MKLSVSWIIKDELCCGVVDEVRVKGTWPRHKWSGPSVEFIAITQT